MSSLFFDQTCIDDLIRAYPELKQEKIILDPCANTSAFKNRIEQLTNNQVDYYDIDDKKVDFLHTQDYMKLRCSNKYDAIITHFPSQMATTTYPYGFTQLLNKALRDVKPNGLVCNLQKLVYLDSKNRYERIYAKYKPEQILVYSGRISMYDGTGKKTNSTIPYCWVVWRKDENGFYSNRETKLDWIYK